jgi:thiol:disulfide interchange protein DsbG
MISSLKKFLTLAALGFALGAFTMNGALAATEDPLPQLPDPIQNLVNEGAQIRYLGKDHGFDSWLTVKNGVEQYFYVLPDRSAFVMGILFDPQGKAVTVQQVKRLQSQGDTLLDSLADVPTANNKEPKDEAFKFKTPSEQLYADLQGSNWVALGKPGAPVMYAFIDPQCPHCHAFIDSLRKGKYLDEGKIQLRLVPVGFKDETRAQAAFLIASPNPQERWFAHMDGDKQALPAKSDINQQGVQRNLALMQSWKFDVTPMIAYRAKDQTIKLVRGTPQDIPAVVNDLGGKD